MLDNIGFEILAQDAVDQDIHFCDIRSTAIVFGRIVRKLDGDDLWVGLVMAQHALAGKSVLGSVAEDFVHIDVGQTKV